jgi:hypothetical protein
VTDKQGVTAAKLTVFKKAIDTFDKVKSALRQAAWRNLLTDRDGASAGHNRDSLREGERFGV